MTKSQKGILEMLAQNAPTESIIVQYPDRSDYLLLKAIEAIIYVECETVRKGTVISP